MKSIRFAVAASAALLCGSAFAANFAETKSSDDLWIQSSKSGYSVEYVGKGDVAGLQFDIYDSSIAEGNYSCGASLASTHIASCNLHEKEGFLRVVIFSLSNAALSDSSLVQVTTGSANSFAQTKSSASLKNVIFSDNKGQNVTPEHL
ncbi:MAG: hypothetical protein MI750_01655 [Xanthomonadales bacterium]|jgi:hypothetical protein|nr:hypothetical protein [Xanthomonadales bacterium]